VNKEKQSPSRKWQSVFSISKRMFGGAVQSGMGAESIPFKKSYVMAVLLSSKDRRAQLWLVKYFEKDSSGFFNRRPNVIV
jgi:hypothetical protein